ncbi:Uncharacterised protein [uncultured archaeon]|nr:Uncharacterised protein [uncultured archaeon]
MMVTDEGQISVDFLLGISIFLLTFGFVIQFIPSLFISTSAGGSLNPVAYRTANILADDPGWWQNKTNAQNGTDWEMHLNDISRIGLATDATPSTRQTRTPKMLNKTKILQVLKLNKTMLTSKLGLYNKISGSQVDYGYNITLEKNGSPMIINGSIISFGETPPTSQDIYKITRQVLVETGNIASFRADEVTTGSSSDKVIVNISGPQSEDVIIQIIDINITNPNSSFDNATLNGSLNIPSDYSVYKRTNTSDFIYSTTPIPLENSTDALRLIFNHTLFPINTTYQLELNFTRMNFIQIWPPYIEYTSKIEPLYEPATLIVEVWK